MRAPILFLLAASLLIVACAPEEIHPTTLRGELEVLDIPLTYTIEQSGYNTGFAGVVGTGEFNETVTFTVRNERITSGSSDIMQLLTISEIKDELWQYVDVMNASTDIKEWGCYEYEQWGIKKIKVCFMRKELRSFEMLTTQGNHQKEKMAWRVVTPQDN